MSPAEFLRFPLAVVCHDAGAANLVIGWLRNSVKLQLRVHMQGQALKLWQSAFPDCPVVSLDEALYGARQLLSGTGWASQLEHDARLIARSRGIPVIAAVDHWVNYRERFVRQGVEILPDEVWISDDDAFAEAIRCFPNLIVRQFPNEYLLAEVSQVQAIDALFSAGKTEHVLYALEPIRQSWSGSDARAGEFQALDYFLSKLNALGLSDKAKIRLRPHPSDIRGKYDSWVRSRRREFDVDLAPEESLAQAVSWADCIAGCESFVLVIGLAVGKKTVSTLPPWGHACRLPQAGLIHLTHLT
jgi:hypothetical protein